MTAQRPHPVKSWWIRILEFVAPLVFFAIAAVTAGLALGVAAAAFEWLQPSGADWSDWQRYALQGIALGASYYVYGFALILIAPLVCFVLGSARLRPYRGPSVSVSALSWYINNAVVFVARYSFLEFVTPTIYLQIFYRLMGMKIGRDVMINSTAITDPSLIELGDRATIGGSASLIAHYGQGGYLVVAPVKIGAGATVGLRATVMAGAEIGEGAKVLANSFVLPNARIPAGETWGGVPAVRLELSQFRN